MTNPEYRPTGSESLLELLRAKGIECSITSGKFPYVLHHSHNKTFLDYRGLVNFVEGFLVGERYAEGSSIAPRN